MRKPILSIIFALILGLEYHVSAQPLVKEAEPVSDVDGNTYKTVQIGYQTWMAQNLRTTKLRNGESLEKVSDNTSWVQSTEPSFCWYNNNPDLKNVYGALYNGYVLSEDVCPSGWRIPSSADWEELQTFLGNNLNIGGKLKETGINHWKDPNYKATNLTGFTALPGGIRNPYDGMFYDLEYWGYWWENSYNPDSDMPNYKALTNEEQALISGSTDKTAGMSIRCIKEGSDSVAPIKRGLLASFSFSGNTNDESGNGHHATSNGVTFVNDRFGNPNSAIAVSGESNSISFENYQLPGPATTLAFWVMPTKDTNDTILKNITPYGLKMVLRTVKKHYQLELTIGDKNIVLNDSRGWSNCDPERPRFDFIGISYNEEFIRFIVNHRLLSEYYFPVDDLKMSFPVTVQQDPTFVLRGILDDLRIYQRSVHEKVMATMNGDRKNGPPVVTADSISLLGRDYARVHSTVNFSVIAEPLEVGVCWGTSPNPDTTHNKATGCCGDVDIVTDIEGLESNTTYYLRAFAVDPNGIGYSNQLVINTLPALNYGAVTDIDGNSYKTIKIGNQTWMAENLKTTRYANGAPIEDGTLAGPTDGKYYYVYDNDPEYKKTYGLLYNWQAATNGNSGETYPEGVQGACPDGWHIPTKAEKDTLINYLGGPEIAGRKLKKSGFAYWNPSSEVATNESGFTALGAGIRSSYENGEASFDFKKALSFFWTSESQLGDYLVSPTLYLSEGTSEAIEVLQPISFGGSVRCIMNDNSVIPFKYGDVDSNTLVQINDALITLKYSVGLNPLPKVDPLPWQDWRIKAADVDTLNGVTAYDASLILMKALGWINTFPAENIKKSLNVDKADVSVTEENGYLVFRSMGELYGLNISIENTGEILGEPQFINSDIMSASNIGSDTFRIGVALARVPHEGDTILKIPVRQGANKLNLDMTINALNKQFTFSSITSVQDRTLNQVEVYPNPADKVINFRNLDNAAVITIFDAQGKTLVKTEISTSTLDISSLPKGIYFIHISNGLETIIRKIVK